MDRIVLVAPGIAPLPPQPSTSVELYLYDLWNALQRRADTRLYGRGAVLGGRPGGNPARRPLHGARGGAYIREVVRDAMKSDGSPTFFQVDNRPLNALQAAFLAPECPVAVGLHSMTFVDLLPRKILQAVMQNAAGVTVNSHYLQSRLFSLLLRASLPAPSVRVIHPGVDTQAFRPPAAARDHIRRERMRERLGTGDRPVILYVGRIIPRKGVEIAMEAVRLARARGRSRPELWIVGRRPPAGSAYGRRLQSASAGIPVRHAGYIGRSRLPEWYRAADVLICPSQGAEAFGLVNLEAQASGLPVVGSGAWGIPEAVEDGKSGLLVRNFRNPVDFARTLDQVLCDSALRTAMALRARARMLERFTWERAASEYLDFYQRLSRGFRTP